MLRNSLVVRGGGGGGHHKFSGVPLEWVHPKGVLKRTFPMREARKHPAFAPNPGGLWASRYVVNMPLVPFEMNFYRIPIVCALTAIILDLIFGLPVLSLREDRSHHEWFAKAHHFWGGNNQGFPHHFWCYQPGWYFPRESPAHRMVE